MSTKSQIYATIWICLMFLGISSCSSDEVLIKPVVPQETTTIRTTITRTVTEDEDRIGNARMIIFTVNGGTEKLWTNQLKAYNSAAITFDTIVPVGYMHLFLIANEAQAGWNLSGITSRADLKQKVLGFSAYPAVSASDPIPMFGQYENVYIDKFGATTISGQPVDLRNAAGTVSRLYAKVTLDLRCLFSELANGGGDPIELKAIRIKQMPTESYIVPKTYTKTEGTDFFNGDDILSNTDFSTYTWNTDSFIGDFRFYIPEYLPAGLSRRTNISFVVALKEEQSTTKEYNVIIGDGIGLNKKNDVMSGSTVSVTDLTVTRNTHYQYKIRIKSFSENSAKDLDIVAKVVSWQPVPIPGPGPDYELEVTPTSFKVGTGAYSGVVLINTDYPNPVADPLTATANVGWINSLNLTNPSGNNWRLSFNVNSGGVANDTGEITIKAGKLERIITITR